MWGREQKAIKPQGPGQARLSRSRPRGEVSRPHCEASRAGVNRSMTVENRRPDLSCNGRRHPSPDCEWGAPVRLSQIGPQEEKWSAGGWVSRIQRGDRASAWQRRRSNVVGRASAGVVRRLAVGVRTPEQGL